VIVVDAAIHLTAVLALWDVDKRNRPDQATSRVRRAFR